MPTFTAQTQINKNKGNGFTLVEAMIAIVIASLMVSIATLNLRGFFVRHTFRGQIHDFISVMQMAVRSAAQTGKRYEVIVNLIEQSYTLREITSQNFTDFFEDEIITVQYFGENCQMIYVQFDDLVETDEQHQIAKFRTGPNGWQNGGRVVFLDRDNNPYTVTIDRMNRIVRLHNGEVSLMMPKRNDELSF